MHQHRPTSPEQNDQATKQSAVRVIHLTPHLTFLLCGIVFLFAARTDNQARIFYYLALLSDLSDMPASTRVWALNHALEKDPYYVKALCERAEAYQAIGNECGALADIQEAIQYSRDESEKAELKVQLSTVHCLNHWSGQTDTNYLAPALMAPQYHVPHMPTPVYIPPR